MPGHQLRKQLIWNKLVRRIKKKKSFISIRNLYVFFFLMFSKRKKYLRFFPHMSSHLHHSWFKINFNTRDFFLSKTNDRQLNFFNKITFKTKTLGFLEENSRKASLSFLPFSQKISILFANKFQSNFDMFFFSRFFSKFIARSSVNFNRSKFQFSLLSCFSMVKFLTGLRPLQLFFSALESVRTPITAIPKILSGKSYVVPAFAYFDKQFKLTIKLFSRFILKKQDFYSQKGNLNVFIRCKRYVRLVDIFLKNQRIFFFKLSKNVFRKNVFFELLNKNYDLYIQQRTFLQYR
jgi:hypothetical protein